MVSWYILRYATLPLFPGNFGENQDRQSRQSVARPSYEQDTSQLQVCLYTVLSFHQAALSYV
jgi:hypothetical protein